MIKLKTFNLKGIAPAKWERVFVFCLHHADSFMAGFLDKEGDFDEGFRELFALPKIRVLGRLEGEKGVQIVGPVVDEVRGVFYRLQEPAFYGKQPNLWEGKLLLKGRELLSISNYTDRLIHLTKGEMALLEKEKINQDGWEEVAMAIVEGNINEPADWDDEELKGIASIISHWLAEDKKH